MTIYGFAYTNNRYHRCTKNGRGWHAECGAWVDETREHDEELTRTIDVHYRNLTVRREPCKTCAPASRPAWLCLVASCEGVARDRGLCYLHLEVARLRENREKVSA